MSLTAELRKGKVDYGEDGRADEIRLQKQISYFETTQPHSGMSDALPVVFMILNSHRQAVYVNRRVLDILRAQTPANIHGKRPGEIFNCVHSNETVGGCGESKICQTCGAFQAIRGAEFGKQTIRECQMEMEREQAANFRVWATPFEENGENFILFSLLDISHEKRREALERTFFHDLLNTASSIAGLADLMQYAETSSEKVELTDLVHRGAHDLVDEIRSSWLLTEAENGQLSIEKQQLAIHPFLEELVRRFRQTPLCEGITIHVEDSLLQSESLHTDPTLLRRILTNLIKNALEASQPGDKVEIGCHNQGEGIEFWIWNSAVMPESVKLRLFKRFYSTKGKGRGIGTYSIKLFTESYLGGKIEFSSEKGLGTRFWVWLPLK